MNPNHEQRMRFSLRWFPPAIAAYMTLVTVSALAGQNLRSLPVADRRLELGGEHAGVLTATDFPMPDGTFAQGWALEAAGKTVTVDLISQAFDAFLMLVGPGIADPLTDDDGAGGCNARITHTLADTGSYVVVVNSVRAGTVGAFTVRVTDAPDPPGDEECFGIGTAGRVGPALDTAAVLRLPRVGTVALGDSVTGVFTDGDPELPDGRQVQIWGFEGRAGASVTIDLLSLDVDAYLTVLPPQTQAALIDDDGAGYCDARLTLDLETDGTYLILAGSLSGQHRGAYALRVTDGPAPPPLPPANEACRTAHTPGSVLAALPEAGRLVIGQPLTDALGSDDPTLPSGAHARAYALDAAFGDELTIDLVSDAFDAFLHLSGPGLRIPLNDDDGGGQCHARITVTFPETGTYSVVVSTYTAATGSFTLRAAPSREASPPLDGECGDEMQDNVVDQLIAMPPQGLLSAESEGSGTISEEDPSLLGEGPYAHTWEYAANTGETVTIDLISDAFDAVVLVVGPGLAFDAMDDDCGDDTNSRLIVTFPEDGSYRVVATTFGPGETGPYTLSVTPGADPGVAGCNSSGPAADELSAQLDTLPVAGTIALGTELHEDLDSASATQIEGSYTLLYEIDGTAGESVTIDLLSDAFDAVLIAIGPGLGLETDDDGAGACNARLTLTFPETATYRVVASSVAPGQTGAFVLRVTAEPGPVDPAACDG